MKSLFSLLNFAGGTFPTGAFSQSWGLETYVFNETIKDTVAFENFLKMYINSVLKRFEGPVFCQAYDLAKDKKMAELKELEQYFLAMRITKESREVVLRTGKAFMRIVAEISKDEKIKEYYMQEKENGISFPIAFGMVCASENIDKDKGLSGFMFSTINGLVQSGLKLIPLGNVQSQKTLINLYQEIEDAVKVAIHIPIDDAFSFSPGLDIASMCHETLPTRLYMT